MVTLGQRPHPSAFRQLSRGARGHERGVDREPIERSVLLVDDHEIESEIAQAKAFQALGATAFIVSSDQSFMRRAAGPWRTSPR